MSILGVKNHKYPQRSANQILYFKDKETKPKTLGNRACSTNSTIHFPLYLPASLFHMVFWNTIASFPSWVRRLYYNFGDLFHFRMIKVEICYRLVTGASQNNHEFFSRSHWISLALVGPVFKYSSEKKQMKHLNLRRNWVHTNSDF